MNLFAPGAHAPRRGFVLLVTLALLSLLSMLAILFVRRTQSEQTVSRCYLERVRARMLAEAGLERAIAGVRAMEMQQAWLDPRDDWSYKELYTRLEFPPADFPALPGLRAPGTPPKALEDAVYVSYYDPAHVKVDARGVRRGYSGAVGGTHERDGDTYSLKILDCASQLNVNNFDLPAVGALPAHPGNAALFRMLDGLGQALGEPNLGSQTILNHILARRRLG
ncbi:MAG: hypothetical protein HYZ53_17155, partial [Planctomycetes bacterium]|nr:hypothetical protein [Planctomycetota bacterium]